MATYLLVHGAWHGAWCWERVKPLLEHAGHRVIAPDLPGMGADRTPLAQVSVETWAGLIAELASAEVEPVILVGHSRAGIVVSQSAEYVPGKIRMLVYLAAFLVPDGRTLLQTMQRIPPRAESEGSLIIAPDGETSVIAPDAFERVFYNRTSPEWVARAAELATAEPVRSFTTPPHITEAHWGRVPRIYIRCTDDRAIAPTLQEMMYTDLPCRRIFTLDTDHSPFYSAPEDLGRVLLDLERASIE